MKVILKLIMVAMLAPVTQINFAQAWQGKADFAVTARPTKDLIMLRWAPVSPEAWQRLNKSGYRVSRITLLRDGKLLQSPEKADLTLTPIKPLPLSKWETLVTANTYAGIAAQALYGRDFQISKATDIGSLVNSVHESEARYSFALLSADLSFEVAKAMGLAFADKTAKRNEKYVYQVYANNDPLNAVSVYTGYADRKELPKPVKIQAEAQNNSVLLSWDNEPSPNHYTAYTVEKSVDGGQKFALFSSTPIINTAKDAASHLTRISKIDSTAKPGQKILYRVKGISPFGETGPASDTVSVVLQAKSFAPPVLIKANENKGKVELEWEQGDNEKQVIGFDVECSQNPVTGYVKINTSRIPASDKAFTDTTPLYTSNYYRVKAYAVNAKSKSSLPVLVQLNDSISPSAPVNIQAKISKAGVVEIYWQRNTEKDVFGYRVFRSHMADGEFSQVSRKPVTETHFTDTVEVKTLSKKIFYKLVALDKHFNPSEFSKTLEVILPDVVPPVPPSLTKVEPRLKGVYLEWTRSSSADVIKHEVYRKPANDLQWKALAEFADSTSSFTDTTATLSEYSYQIKAIDKGLLSSVSAPFSARRLDNDIKPAIAKFSGKANRDDLSIALKWQYQQPEVESYILYKADEGKPLRIYKTLDGTVSTYSDNALFINTIYRYAIKAVFTDGSESAMANIKVNY